MKSEKIKREIKKLREEIGKIKDDRIVPYRDFVEGHGEYKYDLHFLKLELRARRMSDMITTSIFGTTEVTDEEVNEFFNMVREESERCGGRNVSDFTPTNEVDNVEEVKTRESPTPHAETVVYSKEEIIQKRERVEKIKGPPTHLLLPRDNSEFDKNSSEGKNIASGEPRSSIYHATPIYADGSYGDPNLYPLLDL